MKICVIGGGISGSVALLALKRLGFSPAWITADYHPTSKREWPESIDWQGLSLLSEFIDVPYFLRNHIYSQEFHHTCWGSDELLSKNNYRLHKESRGTQLIDKTALTQILFNHATDQCQPILGRVSRITSSSTHWVIHLSNNQTIVADCIVFANGGKSTIQREFCSIIRVDTLQAHHWILRRSQNHDSLVETGSLIEACPTGWWYAATMGQESISLTFFSDPISISSSIRSSDYLRHQLNTTNHLKSWVQQCQWTHFNRPTVFHVHCQHLSQYADSKATDPGRLWISIGDAAIQHDPLSSFGTTNGIWSAVTAAESINNAQANNDQKGFMEYNKIMNELNTSMAKKRLDIYSSETRFSDMPFWSKRIATPSINITEISSN